MRKFEHKFTEICNLPPPTPDFTNILKILSNQQPNRPTLFEFFLNQELELKLSREKSCPTDPTDLLKLKVKAFANAGYDYTTIHGSGFYFKTNQVYDKSTVSINHGCVITDRASYNGYVWNEPNDFRNNAIEKLAPYIPDGMKLIIAGPGGVLENVIALVGYDNLCFMLFDDPELVEILFNEVGTRLLQYYEMIIDYHEVGAIISNDDWGFNTQTMLSVTDMQKYVFPYHKKIVELAHAKNKPVILHSCGQLAPIMGDIIDDMQYNGKHSYEDNITPVEAFYDLYKGKIAVMGGIDLDFLCRKSTKEIYERSLAMVDKTNCIGYALGSGNSIPAYVPIENYLSMISAVVHNR